MTTSDTSTGTEFGAREGNDSGRVIGTCDGSAVTFRVLPVDPAVCEQLRARDDAGATRRPFTDPEGGAPLRCCLRRSAAGERIMLVSYAPLRRWAAGTGAAPGPYDECGPVFLHAGRCAGHPAVASYPATLHGPRRVLRAYSAEGRILGGTLVEMPVSRVGEVDLLLRGVLADPAVELVHVRAVEYGCFLAEVRRG
ncbi:DUF1203 domain-containing protein [Streptomyces sp. 549]|uniref:DUF1203 domain-containing protein n=1 Tax=Streptomyces sp. 549 TaxID=3049076 RepID=UPI0024C327A9|nr:DUF1203 domain-containing protein [Streptomyces sp. 549]MDK1474072.1 DUF1203 domain-containing protein [Streptomyces sp. 549]